MKQYLDLLSSIKNNGVEKESGRANMPNTISISKGEISMNLSDGFPLLTTKKMYWKGIVHELLWFLRGDTNIKYLVDNNVHIWVPDAYRWYLKLNKDLSIISDHNNPCSFNQFIEFIKEGNLNCNPVTDFIKDYKLGDLGKVYGYQWRNQNGVDQIKECLEGLQTNPYSRYHIIDGWNKADFKDMALPPCHLLYQFIVRPLNDEERLKYVSEEVCVNGNLEEIFKVYDPPKFYLDLNMYQRSCDTFLGVPFNIASMSLLLTIFAKTCNMVPGVANWIGGDTHFYTSHIDAINEQLGRIPKQLPKLNIKKELNNLDDILLLTIDDFELIDYESYPAIKAELFTGLKK